MDGVINVMKPQGMTSFDVVRRIRRILKERRVGHTGTLDPLATGVLPVCIGRATKLVNYLQELPKAYRAEIRFGEERDTYDASGKVTRKVEDFRIPAEEVRNVFARFYGEIEQVPPMVSAVHVGGRRLYELAREGKEVPRRPRRVNIMSLEITGWQPDPAWVEPSTIITFDVVCSRGTYIRSLCHDIGQALGVGAYLNSLVRTRACGFGIEDAHTIEEIERASADCRVARYVIPPSEALGHLPALTGGDRTLRLLANGLRVAFEEFTPLTSIPPDCRQVRVVSRDGDLIAIAGLVQGDDGRRMLHPLRII